MYGKKSGYARDVFMIYVSCCQGMKGQNFVLCKYVGTARRFDNFYVILIIVSLQSILLYLYDNNILYTSKIT